MKSSLFQPILLSSLLIITLLIGCGTENEPTFKLTTTVSPVGSGTILPAKTTFDKGEIAILEAVPTNGWKFIRWEGDLTSSVNPVNLGMTRDYNIIGVFERRDYPLTVTVEGQGSVTERVVTAKTTDYPFETIVELTPIPAEGWAFKEWSGDLTGSQSPARITLTGPKTVVARFMTSPTVSTGSVSNLSASGATIAGSVTSDGGAPVAARGICYSTTEKPTISGTCVAAGTGTGEFIADLAGLSQGTTYYVRTYATNSVGMSYGSQVSFKTLTPPVTDIDGNVYPTVQIGTQVWMTSNLKTTRYRDGSVIPNVTDATTWAGLSTGAWSNYDNATANDAIYGKLYNWYAVADARNVCPTGWHVPSDAEWTVLSNFLASDVGHKMKSTSGWSSDGNGSNASGFNGLPGGARGSDGIFGNIGSYGYFWSSTRSVSGSAWYRSLLSDYRELNRLNHYNRFGFSVRCLRD